jgi:NitT/TauT family transport system ATP-binding protein
MTRGSSLAATAAVEASPVLVIDDLVKRFPTPDGTVTAVDHVSFTVRDGEFLSIIGPSGCGKTTVFNIIGGLLDGDEGRVLVEGDAVKGPHRSIGMVFQEESAFPWRNARQNVEFPLEAAGVPRAERAARADRLLRLVGLDGFGNRFPSELSGGMRQRIAIARTLAFQPKILLMDEPFASLDAQTREAMQEELIEITLKAKKTVLFITHQIDEAVYLSDRVIVFSARPGRVRDTILVDIERPRKLRLKRDARFHALEDVVWGLVHDGLVEPAQA